VRDAIEVLNERSHEEAKADSQAPLSLWSADFADLLQKQISMPDGEELQEDEEEPEQGDEEDQDKDDEDEDDQHDELAQEEDQDQDQEMQDDGAEVLTAA
jgi:hypothetical protein|tara:strand:+ start:1451 stop:1750 length:300 start_codon:yes stop_codon:yes gene_type:complete